MQSRTSSRPSLLRSAFFRALLVTGLFVVVVGFAVAWFLLGKTEDLVVRQAARSAHAQVAHDFLHALTPGDVAAPLTGEAFARVDAEVRDHILDESIVRVKVWNDEGTVVYSTVPAQVGETNRENKEWLAALRGDLAWEVSDTPESVFEQGEGRLLEVYMPLSWEPGRPPTAVAEIYQRYTQFEELFGALRTAVLVAGLVAMLTLPLGLYVVYRVGWADIAREHATAAQRLREVEALNGLLQRDVSYALDLRDTIRDIDSASSDRTATPADLAVHHASLVQHLHELRLRADRFFEARTPAPSEVRDPDGPDRVDEAESRSKVQ